MLHTKFGSTVLEMIFTRGQAIAMGHPSYSGDLKTTMFMVFSGEKDGNLKSLQTDERTTANPKRPFALSAH